MSSLVAQRLSTLTSFYRYCYDVLDEIRRWLDERGV